VVLPQLLATVLRSPSADDRRQILRSSELGKLHEVSVSQALLLAVQTFLLIEDGVNWLLLLLCWLVLLAFQVAQVDLALQLIMFKGGDLEDFLQDLVFCLLRW